MAWEIEDETAPAASGWTEEKPRTWGDTASDAVQTIDDAVRAAANAITFGGADRLAGYMNSGGPRTLSDLVTGKGPLTYNQAVDAEVERSAKARERSPVASVVGDVAGSMAIPGLGAEALAARYGSTALARAGAYGLTGAATGAAQGAGNTYTGNLPDYVKNAAVGGAMGGVLGAGGGALFGRGPAVSRAETPNANQLWNEKNVNYRDLANSGAAYEPRALAQVADDIETRLFNERFHPRDSPRTWGAIEEMRGAPAPGQLATGTNAIIDPANIDFIRKGINQIPKTETTATDRASGRIVRNALDDFLVNPPRGAVLPGTEREAARAAALADRARGNYAGLKRVQKMGDFIENAERAAGSTHSGLNIQNKLRQEVRPFLRTKNGTSAAAQSGFNRDEIAALNRYVRGSNPANVLRYLSNAAGGGGGTVGIAAGGVVGSGIGAAAGRYLKDDPEAGALVGATLPIAGLGLRVLGNRRATADLNQLRNLIAQRTPLYQERAAVAGMAPGPGMPRTAKAVRDAITLEILKQREDRPRTRVNIDR